MLQRILKVPGVRQLYARRFERAFAGNWVGAFRGVYWSFEQARAAAPATKPLGYDNQAAAAMYGDRFDTVQPADYPVMLWLDRAMRLGARSVFDWGGHVGLLYYGYRKYLAYPEGFRWKVQDVPQVVQLGRELAEKNGVGAALSFTNDVADATGHDFLLASGSLQYLQDEVTLWSEVGRMSRQPRWVAVNKLPLTEGETFYTLQNIGTAYCPYRVFNSAQFLRGMTDLGYRVVDRWFNPDCSCELPLNPERNVKWYSGVLFERAGSPTDASVLTPPSVDPR